MIRKKGHDIKIVTLIKFDANCINTNDDTYTMKNFIILTLFLITLGLAGCEKVKNNIPIDGTWVEVKEKNDTIDFTQFLSNQAINLRRGYEIRNGHWLPKGGMYFYVLLDSDSIALNSVYSSMCPVPDADCYPHYFFKLSNSNTFEIGNFYNSTISTNELITFSKIE